MKTTLPVIFGYARSGGTLVNRCLGSIPGNLVLSEVNPTMSVKPLDDQAVEWLGFNKPDQQKALRSKDYAGKVLYLNQLAQQQGTHLLIRDWTTVNFLEIKFFKTFPNYILEQRDCLQKGGAEVNGVVLTRRAASVYSSLISVFAEFNDMTIETFAKSYLAFAKAVQGMPVYHYEDFCQQPEAVLQQMCQQLKVNYDPIFTTRFSQFTHCTGDINFTGSSDYSKEAVILPPKVKKTPAYLKAEAFAACQQADALLGYQGKE